MATVTVPFSSSSSSSSSSIAAPRPRHGRRSLPLLNAHLSPSSRASHFFRGTNNHCIRLAARSSSSSSSSSCLGRLVPGKASTIVAETSIFDFTVKDIDKKDVDLSKYKGKVLLVVNVASRCGYTASNYTDLAKLYKKLKGQDFEILAFPCNQFGGQEPGTNQQIKEFACSRFKAEYPIFDKVDVNGFNTAPVYKFLKSSKSAGLFGNDNIKWNFTKFLLDKSGQVVQRYESGVSPLQIEKDIKKLLED